MFRQNLPQFATTITLAFFLGFSHSTAEADFLFGFGQDEYVVQQNAQVDVEVFLLQSDPAGDEVDLTVDGIVSAGVDLLFESLTATRPAFVDSESSITPNPQFDDMLLGQELFFQPGRSAGFADGIDDILAPITGSRILLGTIRFTAGGVVGEVTNLTAQDLRAGEDIIAGDMNLTSLDALVAPGNSSIRVSAVPEPSSLMLMSGAVPVWMLVRRRCRSMGG